MDGVITYGVRLAVATLCGGMLGLERELAGKPAGLRTNVLICVGAALLTHLSTDLPAAFGFGDPARIAAQIVTGIGFLGAGTIMQSRHAVHGLTSAAVIWVVAAVGMLIGAGMLAPAVLSAVAILVVLVVLRRVETAFLGQHTLVCSLAFRGAPPDPDEICSRMGVRRRLLRFELRQPRGDGGALVMSWRGAPGDVQRLAKAVADDPALALEHWEVVE